MMGATGSFSCDACGKSYAWKPEIAGKRVKCKCGGKLTVPATDPAADAAPDGFDDLMALADGAPAHEESYAPPVAAVAPARVAANAGGVCPSCNARVDPAAVICVNCGQNLKTGKKLKTSKLSGDAAPSSAASERVPGYRSFGVKSVEGEGMSPEKKKMLAIGLSAFLVLLVAAIVVIIIKGIQNDRQHQARLNSKPAKLEKLIDNMDKAGGIGNAMHDGTLLNGVKNTPQNTSDEVEAERLRNYYKFEERCGILLANNGPLASEWLKDPKSRFFRYDHAASAKIVDQLGQMGATEIHTTSPPAQDAYGAVIVGGIVGKLPKDTAKRKKIFAWYEGLDHVIEADNQPQPLEAGQSRISIEFRPE
jgi:hypothetical protein